MTSVFEKNTEGQFMTLLLEMRRKLYMATDIVAYR